MKKLALAFIMFVVSQNGCSNTQQSAGSNLDVLNEVKDVVEEDLIIVPWEQEEPVPDPACIECAMYFCPPLDAIWRKEEAHNMSAF